MFNRTMPKTPPLITKDRALFIKLTSCDLKAAYASETAAREGIPRTQMVYQCHLCALWHRARKDEFAALPAVRRAAPKHPVEPALISHLAQETARRYYDLNLTPAIYRSIRRRIQEGNGSGTVLHARLSNAKKWLMVNDEQNRTFLVLYNSRKKRIEEFGSLIGKWTLVKGAAA